MLDSEDLDSSIISGNFYYYFFALFPMAFLSYFGTPVKPALSLLLSEFCTIFPISSISCYFFTSSEILTES